MNKRQKKKQFKHKIVNMNPGEILLMFFNPSEIDIDTACEYMGYLAQIIPEDCSLAITPFVDGITVNKEVLNQLGNFTYLGCGKVKSNQRRF